MEFESAGGIPCPLPNQECKDAVGSYTCECVDGYALTDVKEDGCKSVAITEIENTVRHCHSI